VYGTIVVIVLAWLAGRYENSQWVMPDEHGQVPIRKSWLKKNPEFAPQQA
jgi:hypothetical protein